ncbi:MAG: hypothetical protein KDC98_24325, partial [Planctomycetes bacterium]|nr:hypothetical protein [Planctomycetota bacterium]
ADPGHVSIPAISGPWLLSPSATVPLPWFAFDGSGAHAAAYSIPVGPVPGQAFVLRLQCAALHQSAVSFGAPAVTALY